MDAARWIRLSEAVADALDAPPDVQRALLEERLGDDPALLEEARGLLAATPGAERLEPGGGAALGPLLGAPGDADPWIGRTLDRWRLVAPLGAGGMGSVYLAERVDAPYDQRVALKLLHAALAGQAGRARFGTEQRALARLEHPGIARLIDGGVTSEGVPYLVMERVEGASIDRWCDERALGVRERVRLFLHVCAAVHFAHRHLVVHRDLKPSNVLVDGEGRPRLLDFGIARLLDPELEADDTQTELRALTPRYASPEQVRGEPVSTASDVYSLGVLLYELLTGRPPYEVPSRVPTEIERAVCDSRPDRPSTVVTTGADARATELAARRRVDPGRLRRTLAGDLDGIVLKALAKEPERRFATAGELADDLRRWLDRLPVRARPDTRAYRASRFLRRHRLSVAAVVAVVLALVVGLVATWKQYGEARAAELRERDQRLLADARFLEAQELVRTLVYGVHDRIARLPGATPVRLYLIERTREHLQRLAGRGDIPPTLLDDVAATYLRLGEVQGARTLGSLGDVDGAIESTSAALELLRVGLELEPADLRRLISCADAERQLGDLLRSAGRPLDALDRYAGQRALAERALELAPDSRAALRQQALSLGQAGRLLLDLGREREALPALEAALAATAALLAGDPGNATLQLDLLLRRTQRGAAVLALGRAAPALAEQREALALAVELSTLHPEDSQLAVARVGALVATAEAEHASGELEPCREHLEQALELAQVQVVADPLDVNARWRLLQVHEELGDLAMTRGRLEPSLEAFEQGVGVAWARLEQGPSDFQARVDLARLLVKAADAASQLGDADRAQQGYDDALAVLGDAAGITAAAPVLEVVFAAELGLGDLIQATGARAQARAALERLLERAREHERLFAEVAWPLRNRGLVVWRLGVLHEALAGEPGRPAPERVRELRSARALFDEGLDVALRMRASGWLTPLEADAPEAFQGDLERCDAALAALGEPPGS